MVVDGVKFRSGNLFGVEESESGNSFDCVPIEDVLVVLIEDLAEMDNRLSGQGSSVPVLLL